VVAATVNAQKYNPELIWTQRSPDPRIAQLSDKLRHIRQVGQLYLDSICLWLIYQDHFAWNDGMIVKN
jgi:hypothetical protein